MRVKTRKKMCCADRTGDLPSPEEKPCSAFSQRRSASVRFLERVGHANSSRPATRGKHEDGISARAEAEWWVFKAVSYFAAGKSNHLMAAKEARARIKINKLLEEAGWRLLDDAAGKANVVLEGNVKLSRQTLDEWGDNFEKARNGYVDFLLLDERNFPLIVLEAKAEDKNPLIGKEQARKYARAQNCRFILLSNGNLHYFWDLESGNPYQVTAFPAPDSVAGYKRIVPDRNRLIREVVQQDYIALTQYPAYALHPDFVNPALRKDFFETTGVRFLRPYQLEAIYAIQDAVSKGNDRFLFEMATGTGKTLTSAAVIKLFLRSGNAQRALFLVDRLELEQQAEKAFTNYLKNDYKTVIFKENRDGWKDANIVVTTVQSLLSNNKYRRLFSPTDFDLVISDEAHRSIGGNARAVFEYFVGYKLGLTATPKDYLKKFSEDKTGKDPRESERRLLLDTYRTFGCDSGQPTFRYSLLDGVRDGFLINPKLIDARTEITTQLLSDKGYAVMLAAEENGDSESAFYHRDFEKKFFSENTNAVFCKTFLENALHDPVTGEIGKSIVFAVSQNHAAKLAQLLNEMADRLYPGKYQSDFAMQVTSLIPDAQQMTVNFANNKLGGNGNFHPEYRTAKTRVCVTVGMMTTGYDCTDLLNLCLMRPIFSPTDFIQIKGRGTRRHSFAEQAVTPGLKEEFKNETKTTFFLFDFFANAEYFEDKYDYGQILKLPPLSTQTLAGTGGGNSGGGGAEVFDLDSIALWKVKDIGPEGMKVDRMFFDKFEDKATTHEDVKRFMQEGNARAAAEIVRREIFDQPFEYFNMEKLRKALRIDWRIDLTELLDYIFTSSKERRLPAKQELLEEEFSKFVADYKPAEEDDVAALRYFFMAYVTDGALRQIIDEKRFTDLNVNATFSMQDFKAVGQRWRSVIPEYVKDYVPLNKFA
jgi:type I restriction enzyme R subunit